MIVLFICQSLLFINPLGLCRSLEISVIKPVFSSIVPEISNKKSVDRENTNYLIQENSGARYK